VKVCKSTRDATGTEELTMLVVGPAVANAARRRVMNVVVLKGIEAGIVCGSDKDSGSFPHARLCFYTTRLII
jgi:hypothetical protein